MASVLDYLLIERFGVQIPAGAEILFAISAPQAPLSQNEYTDRVTVHCKWEGEAVKETL